MGATDAVAWGFTNVCGDFEDLIVVETDRDDPTRYRTPDSGASRWERFGEIVEVIEVRGAEPVELRLRTTRWGVVTGEDRRGRPLVLQWSALDPSMHNLDLFDMPGARTLEEAVAILRGAWIPPQNALIVSRDGRLAWVMVGRLPERTGFDGRTPASWAKGGVGWTGEASRRPMVVDPPGGALFTANQRTTPPEWSRTLGRMWANPSRAARIRELLAARDEFDEGVMRAMQQDTRADLMEWYRALALGAVADGDGEGAVRRARGLVEEWNGRADADQPGFRILKEFRRSLLRSAIDPLVAPCVEHDPSFTFVWWLSDETLARLLEERPEHLLAPRYADWEALTREAFAGAVASIERAERAGAAPGVGAPWGELNRARLRHPLARAVPALGPLLDMPDLPLSGDTTVVRVATSTYGAGMRLVASPSRLEDATLTIAGGQSGHFLSPHYRDEFRAWAEGGATPLLAGAARCSFLLVPSRGATIDPGASIVGAPQSAGAASP
jgi:penicillin amidase